MNTEIVPVSESFNNVLKNVRESDTPSKEVIVSLTQAAYQAVVEYLAEDNMAMAIDTMEKTKAIEDYVKAKVHHQQMELYHANIVTATRFDMLREIGWWLDENLAEYGEHGVFYDRWNKIYRPVNMSKQLHIQGKPKFFLRDLEITHYQSERWQAIARLPEEEYRAWLNPYLHDGIEGKENELYFSRLYSYARPKKTVERVPLTEIEEQEMRVMGSLVVYPVVFAGFTHIKELGISISFLDTIRREDAGTAIAILNQWRGYLVTRIEQIDKSIGELRTKYNIVEKGNATSN